MSSNVTRDEEPAAGEQSLAWRLRRTARRRDALESPAGPLSRAMTPLRSDTRITMRATPEKVVQCQVALRPGLLAV